MNGGPLLDPGAVLFPSIASRNDVEHWLTEELARALEAVKVGSVVPTLDLAQFDRTLAHLDFDQPQPLRDTLHWVIESLQSGIVQMSNPRYFGLFNPAPSFPAQCADRITSLFNPQLASSASSPVPVALERAVIAQFAARAGLSDGSGHFATGGSEANLTAVLCALTAAHPGFATDGARAFAGPPVFYASRECHIAWLKIAHQCGIGRSGLRLVATNGRGELDSHALADMIAADRAAGAVPVMIAATAGTTGGGMIDPLAECATLAASEGLWFHVDAAWGGAALASPRLRGLLAGIERADSITIDAHKWLATTMGCAMFITAHGDLLSKVFHASTSFMPSSVAGLDPYLNSVQWSRRFLGLRLFVALRSAGWDGMAAHVERGVALTAHIRERLLVSGWTLANESALAVLAMVPPAHLGDVRALVRRVVASGRAWVATATFEGRDVVRICVTHGESSLDDVEKLVAVLNASA